jgi:hypothetical protein
MYGQTDDFPEKLKAGCKSLEECQQLKLEADARDGRCRENTIGYLRCSDTRADQMVASSYVQRWLDWRDEKRQKEEDERSNAIREREQAETARQRDAETARLEELETRRQKEAAERASAAEAAKAEEQQKAMECSAPTS